MKRIELYIDDNDRVVFSLYKTVESEYESKILRGKDTYDAIRQISNNKIKDIYENPNGEDITLEYNDYIVTLNEYKKILPRRGLGPIRENIRIYEEQEALKKVEFQKVKRVNKHKGKKIIATGISLIVIGSCIFTAMEHAKASNKENIVCAYPGEIVTTVMEDDTINYKPEIVNLNNDNIEKVLINYSDRSESDKAYKTQKYYGTLISKYANIYGLDPVLVTAIATQERGVHSTTIDDGGAIGLMQIQNNVWSGNTLVAHNFATGKSEKIIVDSSKLSDISYNIKIGCMILQNTIQYMNYNVLAGIQCYNMGYGNMKKVLTAYATSTNKTIDQVLNNIEDDGWLNYRNLIKVGDQTYLEHVLSWIGKDFNIKNLKLDGTQINLNITNNESKKVY